MPITHQLINQFVKTLIEEETYNEEEGVWVFADGSPCLVCVSSASRIAREFDGVIMGYWSKANPTAAIGHKLCKGHDFAFIADRWIVDYWAFRIAWIIHKPVFDLESELDRVLATNLFGERNAWEAIML